MPRAKLTLSVPDGVWIGDVSRSHPDARFRILAAIAEEGSGVGLAEVNARDPRSVVADLLDAEPVTELEVLTAREEEAIVEFETTDPLLLLPVQGAGVPLEMPFDIQDGEATWELTANQRRLSDLGDQLEAFGIDFTVEYVRQYVEDERPLTDRQRSLLVAAVERGYYDTPRGCSLTELAEAVGIAKSTCSETLHRAEEAIIKRYVRDLPETERSSPADGREQSGVAD